PILSLDLARLEPADPRVNAWSGGHYQGQHYFIRAGRIGKPHFYSIEMAAHVRGIDMRDRHVEPRSRAADLLGRRHDRFGAAQGLAHSVSSRDMPERAVLDFAAGADDSALAVSLDRLGITAECLDQVGSHAQAQGFQVLHETLDFLDIPSGKGIANDRQRDAALQRVRSCGSALMKDLFDRDQGLADQQLSHALRFLSLSKRADIGSDVMAPAKRVQPCRCKAAAVISPRARACSAQVTPAD